MVSDGRGQLLLVAAVLIAVVIVAAAVLLNGVLAPGTSATRGLSAEVDALERDVGPLREDLEGLFERTTSIDGPYDEPLPYAARGDLVENVTAFGGALLNGTARERGSILRVAYNDSRSVRGSVVLQRPGTPRTYTSNGVPAEADWQLATDVSEVPRATFEVTDVSPGDEAAVVVSGSGGDRWSLNVSAANVRVEGTGVADRTLCDPAAYPGDAVVIEIRNARRRNATASVRTPDGRVDCEPFAFGGDVSGAWTIALADGDAVSGRYVVGLAGTATVGAPAPAPPASRWPERVGGNPVINPAIDVTYVADGITYESTFGLYNRTAP